MFASALLVSMVSCKKDYTCDCKTSVDGTEVSTFSTPLNDVTKSDAEDACDAANVEATTMGITSKTECELK